MPKTLRCGIAGTSFYFGYLAQRINFIDLAGLKWSKSINLDRLYYRKEKTGKLFTVKVQGKLEEILNHPNPDGYIFPILNSGLPEHTVRHRIKTHIKKVNKDLKVICK